MKKKVLIAGLLVQALLAGAVIAAEQIGHVVSIEGAAKAQSEDGSLETLQLKSQVYLNDRIITEAGAKVQIMLADDALIMVGENSEMTLDAYVYSPDVAAENETSIGLVRGVFRVVTAKITDLNPKRFHVKSKMATIGIRGCELGFDVGAMNEEIQIIRVPESKEIVVSSELGDGKELHVFQQGVLVNVNPKTGMTDRPLTAADIGRITRATTPSASAIQASAQAPGTPLPAVNSTVKEVASQREASIGNEVAAGLDLADSDVAIDAEQADVSSLETARSGVDEAVDASSSRSALPAAQVLPAQAAVQAVAALAPTVDAPRTAGISPMDTTVETVVEGVAARTQPTPTAEAGEEPAPGDGQLLAAIIDLLTGGEEPEPTYPVIGTRVNTPQGGGADWSWGTWSREDTVGSVDGTPELRNVIGAEVSGNELTAAEFQALAGVGSPLQTLTGTGIAGAGVTQGNQGALLTGTSDITLQVGLGVASTWNGAFDLSSSTGDQLQFSSAGTLNPSSGALATSASGYSLNAFGTSHGQGSLTRNEVRGSLVGNSGQITGNTGTFDFEHGATGPAVQGVFGTDLAP